MNLDHAVKVDKAKASAIALLVNFDSCADLTARIAAVESATSSYHVMRAVQDVVQCAVSFDSCLLRATMLVVARANVTSFTASQMQSLTLRCETQADNAAMYVIKACELLNLMSYDKATKVAKFNTDSELFKSLLESASYYLEDDTLQDKTFVKDVFITAKRLKLM